MQRSNGFPLPKESERSLYKAAAQGWRGAPPISPARFCKYLPSAVRHKPDKSGLPSASFGAGADKIGLPSGVRGVFGSVTATHWADTAEVIAKEMVMSRRVGIYLLTFLPRVVGLFLYFT